MKSHELAKLLLELPNYEIIMSTDQEGNGYSTIEVNSVEILKENKEYGNKKDLIILSPDKERLELDEV